MDLTTPIDVRGLQFGYDNGALFSDLDLRVEVAERIGLTGPNGSGKTTLLHMLMGLRKPAAGELRFFGRVCQNESDFVEVRRRIGLQFQDPDDQLFCPTVAEDIAFGPLNNGTSHDDALALVTQTLAKLGLGGFENRVTHHLSAGEKRLVSLGTVLAMEPEVLLFDEPTAGLDEVSEKRIAGILSGLPQAMIIVSHDVAFLRDVCSSLLRFNGGQLHPVE